MYASWNPEFRAHSKDDQEIVKVTLAYFKLQESYISLNRFYNCMLNLMSDREIDERFQIVVPDQNAETTTDLSQ